MSEFDGGGEFDELTEMNQLIEEIDAAFDGEPGGLDFARLAQDRTLQRLAIQLWRDMQSRASISKQKFEELLRREDLTPADLWAPGLTEGLTVDSTVAEIDKYKAKLRIRAEILTALLAETNADLGKAERWVGSDKAVKKISLNDAPLVGRND